jgi:hypothetical protein
MDTIIVSMETSVNSLSIDDWRRILRLDASFIGLDAAGCRLAEE